MFEEEAGLGNTEEKKGSALGCEVQNNEVVNDFIKGVIPVGKVRNGLGSGERVKLCEVGTGVIHRVPKPVLRDYNSCSISSPITKRERKPVSGLQSTYVCR